ncbi:MAG TPA: sugar transferase [Paracoccus sp. (in: a-proteobacteria)]|nr:sugar transferase [Paracoccus sp. (in: a-proteobacteria)]
MLDLGLALAVLPFVVPTITLLMLIVLAQGRNPVAWDLCRGRNGQPFRLWKIRTEAEGRGRTVTEFDRFLRETSLDELPRILNLLRGDISLVGPRLLRAGPHDCAGDNTAGDLAPGLTGPWQLRDPRMLSVSACRECDIEYDRSLSLRGDLDLLLRSAANHSAASSPLALDE